VAYANRYRHSSILAEATQLLIYGGFEPDLPNKPLDTMIRIDVSKLIQGGIKQLPVATIT